MERIRLSANASPTRGSFLSTGRAETVDNLHEASGLQLVLAGERLVEFLFEQAHLAFCKLRFEREFVGDALFFG